MKSIKHIYKASFMAGLLAVGTTSCTDWLTIYPQDRVVEENFWEDKNDLEGVRYGAYKQMAITVARLAIWGDLRSDAYNLNTTEHSDQRGHKFGDEVQNDREIYKDIMHGLPDSSMKVFDWGGVYKTINYCNKVLQHGPEVLAKDKQFTTSEWNQMRAEMVALRSLNYFYLIRAFKDVPYTTKVVNSDKDVESFPATNQLVILDSLIKDCERVKGMARNRFSALQDSKGLITNSAIYSMLADMYLWRASLRQGRFGKTATDMALGEEHSVPGDYQKAADYADEALASLAQQNADEEASQTINTKVLEKINYPEIPNCSFIKNDFDGVYQSTTPKLEAHTAIFETGNSTESIFEIQYRTSETENPIANDLYGHNNGTLLMVCTDAVGNSYGGWGNAQFDSRMWICAQNKISTGSSTSGTGSQALSGYYCMKYSQKKDSNTPWVTLEGVSTNREIKNITCATTSESNWIIYRMTDVLLLKAEALACINDKDTPKKIVNAIHRRSYCNYTKADFPSTADLTKAAGTGNATNSGTDPVMWVMHERQLELLGEGKRWFDLVRYAERNADSAKENADERESTEEQFVGDGQVGMEKMVETFLQKAYSSYYKTLQNRFKNRYGLYCPIYYMEVKASDGVLQQNPVWNKSKYEQ